MVGDILQPTHLLFVLIVALLVLGPKRLPEVGRALGRGLRDFRNAMSGEEAQEQTIPVAPQTAPPSAAAPSPGPAPAAVQTTDAPPTDAPNPAEPVSSGASRDSTA